VAHSCNPNYSGGRDQEYHGSKQIVYETYLKRNSSQKRAGGVAQSVGLEFKPQYCKKKKRRKEFLLGCIQNSFWRHGSSGRTPA
jgi:hypothetical protein